MLRAFMLCDLALLLINRLRKNIFLVNVPLKWLPPKALFSPKCTKYRLAAGLRPDPLGELTALRRPPIAGFKGRTSKGTGEEERERKEVNGGRVKREGRSGEGKGEYASLALRAMDTPDYITEAAENGVARPKRPRPYSTRSSANVQGSREHTVS